MERGSRSPGSRGTAYSLEDLTREEAVSIRAERAVLVVVMAVVIVGADVLFLRGHFWERLAANIAIVLVFGTVYYRFLRS
jgi:type IV secretory pathway VirB2 component (pilin)